MSSKAHHPARVVVVTLGAVVLVGAGLAAGLWAAGRSDPQAAPAAASTATAPGQSSAGADGCAGGVAITSASLRQAQATLSTADATSAAAFAAAIFRWMGTDPGPGDVDELTETVTGLLAPDATAPVREALTSSIDLAKADGLRDDWTATTVGGRYYVETHTDTETTVSVMGSRVFTDGTRQTGSESYVLTPSPAGWLLRDIKALRATSDLQAIGTPFTGGR
jgi:hypothetical protein